MPKPEVALKLPSPVGFLEALFRELPEETADPSHRGGVIILHPHPLYGGNMHNKTVFTAQKVFTELGLATLRFNFRGVGISAGAYDDGQGEQDDVLAAVGFMRQRMPSLPLYLAGFSFGAWLALKVGAAQARIKGLIAIGTPVSWAELDFLGKCEKPKLFVHGTQDQYCDPNEMEKAFGLIARPKQIFWIEGADHFFTDRLDRLAEVLRDHFPWRSD